MPTTHCKQISATGGELVMTTESVPENVLTRDEYLAVCKLKDSCKWLVEMYDKDKDDAYNGINKLLRRCNEEKS